MKKWSDVYEIERDSNKVINNVKDKILETVPCKKIYLFGSYAYGTPNEDSDFDFYIVIPDDYPITLHDVAVKIYGATSKSKGGHPIDVMVNSLSNFEERKPLPTLERTISSKGVLLYESE